MITVYMGRPLDKMARQSGLHFLRKCEYMVRSSLLQKVLPQKQWKVGGSRFTLWRGCVPQKCWWLTHPSSNPLFVHVEILLSVLKDVIRHQHASWTWILPPFTVLVAELFVGGEISPCIHISARECNPDHLPILSRDVPKDTVAHHFWMGS